MPFREKSAWINLICLAVALVFFVASFREVWMFVYAVLAFVGLQIVLHTVSARLTPKDARTPLDEREQTIRLKATRNAYLALVIGVFGVPFSLHFGHLHGSDSGVWFRVHTMAYIAVVAIIVGEVVRAVSQIVYFRLGR
jgi:hypothetical protein